MVILDRRWLTTMFKGTPQKKEWVLLKDDDGTIRFVRVELGQVE